MSVFSVPGFSKYHSYGMIVPVLAAISPMWLSRVRLPIPQAFLALVCGALVALLAYVVFKFVPWFKESMALSKAVLLGVLTAEVLIFHSTAKLPPMAMITLYLFLYWNATESISVHGGH